MHAHAAILAIPSLSLVDEGWLFAEAIGGELEVRRSYWLDDLTDYPDLEDYIREHNLVIDSEVEEDDEYLMGGAIVTMYIPAPATPQTSPPLYAVTSRHNTAHYA